jgi:hypothetical protein
MPHTRSDDQTVEAFSLPKDLLEVAKVRAAAKGMSKSGYFRYCLAKELGYSEEEALSMANHRAVTALQNQVRHTVYDKKPLGGWRMNEKINSKSTAEDAAALAPQADPDKFRETPILTRKRKAVAPSGGKRGPSGGAS